ncbi:unnamed protein product, partial [Heterosigma akashiwo]
RSWRWGWAEGTCGRPTPSRTCTKWRAGPTRGPPGCARWPMSGKMQTCSRVTWLGTMRFIILIR